MPFSRPTLTDLRNQVATDINAETGGIDALLRFSNLGILGAVQAALASGHYGYLDWIARQIVPFTATDEYLEGWAALKGVTRKAATPGSGQVVFTAVTGSIIPDGTLVSRSDGREYHTRGAVTANAGFATVSVFASLPGADGNALPGVGMFLRVGIVGVTGAGAVATALVGGADVESDDLLRSRMLQVYASPPQGGAITDYPNWALAVPGVTRAWAQPGALGPGTIAILFMMDTAEAAYNGFPQGTNGCSQYEARDTAATGDQLLVADAIFPRQSVTALAYAVAPTPNVIAFTIRGLGATPATALQASIGAAIDAALLVGAVPGGRTYLSTIEAAIASIAGAAGFVITAESASTGTIEQSPVGNILSSSGALPVRGAVTYTL
jgi:uncharacterized phage protein gp47/JayE